MISGIKPDQLNRLNKLISDGQTKQFYSWRAWRDHIRPEVLKLDHNECYYCRKPVKGKNAIIHHVQPLTVAPDLALSIWTPDGRRQLVTVCKACHELRHPEVLKENQKKPAKSQLTVECWQ